MSGAATTPELLPCPFCGSQAKVDYDDLAWWYVACLWRECEIRGPLEGDEADAIAAWNRRAPECGQREAEADNDEGPDSWEAMRGDDEQKRYFARVRAGLDPLTGRAPIAATEASEPENDHHHQQQEHQTMTTNERIAGAIYDFAAYLTTRPGTLEVGSGHDAAPMVEAIKEWGAARGFETGGTADVNGWQQP